MHVKSISKIPAHGYVNKHIKLKCEYHMKVYGYNPLDNPPQKCDNVSRLKGRISPMTYAHSRFGSSTSDWQTLQDHCKVDVRRETRDAYHVSCLTSSPLVSCLPSLQSPALARPHLSRALYLAPLTLLYYIVRFHPLFKSSLHMKYSIESSPDVCYNIRRHGKKRLFYKGCIKSCELKHV